MEKPRVGQKLEDKNRPFIGHLYRVKPGPTPLYWDQKPGTVRLCTYKSHMNNT